MRSALIVIGFLAAIAACVLVTFYMLGDLGRDSDRVMLGTIACIVTCALCFWAGSRGDDAPRGGGR